MVLYLERGLPREAAPKPGYHEITEAALPLRRWELYDYCAQWLAEQPAILVEWKRPLTIA